MGIPRYLRECRLHQLNNVFVFLKGNYVQFKNRSSPLCYFLGYHRVRLDVKQEIRLKLTLLTECADYRYPVMKLLQKNSLHLYANLPDKPVFTLSSHSLFTHPSNTNTEFFQEYSETSNHCVLCPTIMLLKLLIPFTLAVPIGVCATPVFHFPDVICCVLKNASTMTRTDQAIGVDRIMML